VRLEQTWRWGRGDTIYLDASCITYGFNGERLATVDYSNQRSVSGASASGHGVSAADGAVAITHSGDVLDQPKHTGTHVIDVNLRALSPAVECLYLTLSAWTTTLDAILRPEIRCFDPEDSSGEPLARYELEGRATGAKTSVLMARISRETVGGRWKVTAMGELGMGRAGTYTPIYTMIDTSRRSAAPLRVTGSSNNAASGG